jgi:hypothetical protein
MRIDRVIFGWDGAGEFGDYLALNARAYARLGIRSTVVYCGDQPLNQPPGMDAIHVQVPLGIGTKPPRNWVPTIALLWGACQYPGEVVMTSGLDQVPLSRRFIDATSIIRADLFVGFAGSRCYDDHGEVFGCNYYPSTHLVATSEVFQRILGFSDWDRALETVRRSGVKVMWPDIADGWWGIDEAFFSRKLFEAEIAGRVTSSESDPGWWEDWHNRRLGRSWPPGHPERILQGEHTELHGSRPIRPEERVYAETFINFRLP